MYRQPLAHARIQESLIFFFGIASLLRLALTVPAGTFSMHAVMLTAEAIPVVLFVTVMAARRPPPLSERPLKAVVCFLLILTGAGLVGAALSAMSGTTLQPGRSHAAVEGITGRLRHNRPALQPASHKTRVDTEPAGHRAG
jgi:hypothetical protein